MFDIQNIQILICIIFKILEIDTYFIPRICGINMYLSQVFSKYPLICLKREDIKDLDIRHYQHG